MMIPSIRPCFEDQVVGDGLETLSSMTVSKADLACDTNLAVLASQLKVMKLSALTVSNLNSRWWWLIKNCTLRAGGGGGGYVGTGK